ncbi:MAG: hypothetical protein WC374_08655, partial [Phycisphaerae bacterium]
MSVFLANLPFIINILVFIGYFIVYNNHTAWPGQFLWWAWLPYVAYLWFDHQADGLQNTTRNIARIYLLRKYGTGYDNNLVTFIQAA